MMAKVTAKFPVTLHMGGAPIPPGETVTLDEAEFARIAALFGGEIISPAKRGKTPVKAADDSGDVVNAASADVDAVALALEQAAAKGNAEDIRGAQASLADAEAALAAAQAG